MVRFTQVYLSHRCVYRAEMAANNCVPFQQYHTNRFIQKWCWKYFYSMVSG